MNPKRDSKAGKNTLKNTPYPRLFLVLCFSLPVILFISAMPDQAGGKMHESKPTLPKTVGLWTKPDSPQFVNAKNIFDYMDGAGELYIGYRFDRLESYEYKAQKQKSIIGRCFWLAFSGLGRRTRGSGTIPAVKCST
jgi:hypothetical protein